MMCDIANKWIFCMNNLLASSNRSVVQGSYCVSLGYLWLISLKSIKSLRVIL